MSLFEELKRRNVIRIAILYLVSSWVLLQLADVLSSLLNAPEFAGSIVVMLLILGFFPTLIFAWVWGQGSGYLGHILIGRKAFGTARRIVLSLAAVGVAVATSVR